MPQIPVYSKVFLEGDTSWCATPSSSLLRRIHAGEESARWIVVVKNGDVENKIALGDPVNTDQGDQLFMPVWFLNRAELSGDGESLDVRFERSEVIPRATRLVFKVLGDLPEWLDVCEVLEEPLSQLGVLTIGQVIPVPIVEGTMLELEICEPLEQFVFMDGADVVLEIEYMAASAAAPAAASAAAPAAAPASAPQEPLAPASLDDFSVMLPYNEASKSFQGKGNTLGRR